MSGGQVRARVCKCGAEPALPSVSAGDFRALLDMVTLLVGAITRRDAAGELNGSMGFVTDLTEVIDTVREDRQRFRDLLRNNGGEVRHFQSRLRHQDGREVHVSTNAQYYRNPEGGVTGVEGFARGIDDLRRTRSELRLAAEVLRSAGEAIVIVDANWQIISVNPAFSRLTGFAVADAVGKPLARFIADPEQGDSFEPLARCVAGAAHWRGEVLACRAQGDAVFASLSLSTVSDEQGRPTHRVAMMADISERKAAQARFEFLAHHDALTELPNRLLFRDRVEQAIEQARRGGTNMALLFVDLDRFKAINDSLGHLVGDRVLLEVARRLQGGVRGGDTVCRLGGDEFLVALGSIASVADAERVAACLARQLAAPLEVDGHVLQVGCAIGVATYPAHGTDCEALLKRADAAMYAAKAPTRTRIDAAARPTEAMSA